MNQPPTNKSASGQTRFSKEVGEKAQRKLKAQRRITRTVWSGLGMMGMIGWSVAVPTLLGAALGTWLDKHYAGERSWTLALLALGLALGCYTAWHWVAREYREMDENDEEQT